MKPKIQTLNENNSCPKITLSVPLFVFLKNHSRQRSRVFQRGFSLHQSHSHELWSAWFEGVVEDANVFLTGVECHPQGQAWVVLERQSLAVLGPVLRPEKWRRKDPSCRLADFSCSHTHFTGVRVGGLEGSPAFQGHPQGLCDTAHHPQGRGRGKGREGRGVMQVAPQEREIGIRGDEKEIK